MDKNMKNTQTDNVIITLVEKSITDPQRKELYLKVIPKLTADEKLQMLIELLDHSVSQLEHDYEDLVEQKLEEIYDSKDDAFDTTVFAEMADELLVKFSDGLETGKVETMAASDKSESQMRAQEIAAKLKQIADEVSTLAHSE